MGVLLLPCKYHCGGGIHADNHASGTACPAAQALMLSNPCTYDFPIHKGDGPTVHLVLRHNVCNQRRMLLVCFMCLMLILLELRFSFIVTMREHKKSMHSYRSQVQTWLRALRRRNSESVVSWATLRVNASRFVSKVTRRQSFNYSSLVIIGFQIAGVRAVVNWW